MTRRYALGNQIIYDVLKREISIDEYVVSIGGREAVILKLLCDNVNRVLSKEDIQDKVWGNVFVSETSLTKAISNLRKSLAQFDCLACEIKTISKEGYMLILDESITDIFMTEEAPILEVKNIVKSDKTYFNHLAISSSSMDVTAQIRAEFPVKSMFFILICFASALLAAMLATAAVMVLSKLG